MTAPSIKEALELKPCPFCGEHPRMNQGGEPEHVTIGCNNDGCLVQLCVVSETEHDAVAAWNTRATLSPPAGERREAIARAICKAKGVNPDCLHQNYDDEPIDHTDARGRTYHYGWRNQLHLADAAILASGLVQDEAYTAILVQKLADAVRDNAAIRADEREKCAQLAALRAAKHGLPAEVCRDIADAIRRKGEK